MSFFIKDEQVYDAFRVPVPGVLKMPDGTFEKCLKGDWFVKDCEDITKISILKNDDFQKQFIPIDRIEGVA